MSKQRKINKNFFFANMQGVFEKRRGLSVDTVVQMAKELGLRGLAIGGGTPSVGQSPFGEGNGREKNAGKPGVQYGSDKGQGRNFLVSQLEVCVLAGLPAWIRSNPYEDADDHRFFIKYMDDNNIPLFAVTGDNELFLPETAQAMKFEGIERYYEFDMPEQRNRWKNSAGDVPFGNNIFSPFAFQNAGPSRRKFLQDFIELFARTTSDNDFVAAHTYQGNKFSGDWSNEQAVEAMWEEYRKFTTMYFGTKFNKQWLDLMETYDIEVSGIAMDEWAIKNQQFGLAQTYIATRLIFDQFINDHSADRAPMGRCYQTINGLAISQEGRTGGQGLTLTKEPGTYELTMPGRAFAMLSRVAGQADTVEFIPTGDHRIRVGILRGGDELGLGVLFCNDSNRSISIDISQYGRMSTLRAEEVYFQPVDVNEPYAEANVVVSESSSVDIRPFACGVIY